MCSAIGKEAWWATVHGVPKESDMTQPQQQQQFAFFFFFACFELFIVYWGTQPINNVVTASGEQ